MKRILIHIPAGLIITLGASLSWVLALSFVAMFLFYERDEDHWLKDQAWKDVAGALYGLALGVIIWAGLAWL